jgi:hypothetical protein
VVLGFVCMILSWIKLRPVHAAWITGNWFLIASVTFLVSTPRYTLTMYPVFMLFGLLGRSRLWIAVITVWSCYSWRSSVACSRVSGWAF